jgi:hypothetical protein
MSSISKSPTVDLPAVSPRDPSLGLPQLNTTRFLVHIMWELTPAASLTKNQTPSYTKVKRRKQ